MAPWDARLQYRYGFYLVYTVVTAFYVLGLQLVPAAWRADAIALVVVTDPAVLGFYFVGALVLFEKDQGVLDALVTTPLGVAGYLSSKVVSLTLLAIAAAGAITVLGAPGPVNLPMLVLGVTLTSVFFVLVGFLAVARYDSVNRYFLSAVGYGTVLFAPIVGYLDVYETPLFALLPLEHALVLVAAAFRPTPLPDVLLAVAYLSLGSAVAFVLARRSFRTHIVRGRRRRSARTHTGTGRVSNPIAALALSDLRNWSRDPMLVFAALGPFLFALVLRFGLPLVDALLGPTVDVTQYDPLAAGMLLLFTPFIYGFVVGIFLLEDRESGVLTALRQTPLSADGYLLYRATTVYGLAVLGTIPTLLLFGHVAIPLPLLLGATLVSALAGPVTSLLFASYAANTIEGLALNKLLGIPLLIPLAAIALVPEPLQYATGLLPTYWPVKALVAGLAGESALPFLAVGALVYLGLLAWMRRVFARQTG